MLAILCDIQTISYWKLAFSFVPVLIVLFIMFRWGMGVRATSIAVLRMLIQLLLIGYVLAFIFRGESSWLVMGVLFVMLFAAGWISLRTVHIDLKKLIHKSFASILLGGGSVLILITQVVLDLEIWFEPSFVIPLAGMIFANSMNAISLAGERLEAELERNEDYRKARNTALRASLIPITNALLAVGLVSLPGMMTGQILSGVSPFIAARYQIMVMCMIFSASGLSSVLFLQFSKEDFLKEMR